MSRNNPSRKQSKPLATQSASVGLSVARPKFRIWLLIAGLAVLICGLWFWFSESPQSYYARGQAVLEQQPAKAEELARLAIEVSGGDFPAAQLLQCRALAATNQWDAALGGFSLIRDTGKCDPVDLADLGTKAFASQQFQLGEMALEAARRSEHPPARVFELLVPWRLQQRELTEALEMCRVWQEVNRNDPRAWAIAGDLEATNLNLSAAISDYREALRHTPAPDIEIHVRSALVQLYADIGDVAAAREHLDIVLKTGLADKNVQLKAVEVLRMEGKLDEAIREINRYLEKDGKSAEALKQRGILYLDQGEYSSAIRDLKQAVGENPFDKAAHIKLAQAYVRSGQQELAEPHFEKHRRLTAATNRILELNGQLERDPHNELLKQQLKELGREIGLEQSSEN